MFGLTPYENRRTAITFDPFGEMEKLQRAFFSDRSALSAFQTDIRDEGDSYLLEADLPGFKKEDIKIDLERDMLTISAQRRAEHEEKDDKGGYVRRERSYGSYERRFDISGIRAEDVSANYSDGVLRLTLPKKEAVQPVARRLEIH